MTVHEKNALFHLFKKYQFNIKTGHKMDTIYKHTKSNHQQIFKIKVVQA